MPIVGPFHRGSNPARHTEFKVRLRLTSNSEKCWLRIGLRHTAPHLATTDPRWAEYAEKPKGVNAGCYSRMAVLAQRDGRCTHPPEEELDH